MVILRIGDVTIPIQDRPALDPATGNRTPSRRIRAATLAQALERAGYPVRIHGLSAADFRREDG